MRGLSKKILRLYRAGDSGHAISRELGLSPMQVYYILKKNGVACRKQSEALGAWWKKRKAVTA